MTEIRREHDAAWVNHICNHPDVRPWLGGYLDQKLELGPTVENPRNVVLSAEKGAMIFMALQPGLYEAHTQILPDGRGRWTLEFVLDALRYMFTATDAIEIVTRVPYGNLRAASALRALGRVIPVVHEFDREYGWVENGIRKPASFHSIRIQDWIRAAPELIEAGEEFHRIIEDGFARAGRKRLAHPEDANHDRHAGCAFLMAKNGQPLKATIFYNRWALQTGYMPIHVSGVDPITINIGEAEISARGETFEVMPCL